MVIYEAVTESGNKIKTINRQFVYVLTFTNEARCRTENFEFKP